MTKAIIKNIVREFNQSVDSAVHDTTISIERFVTEDYLWRGMHPFYEQVGAENVANVFWEPLKKSFKSIQRRTDIFFAGDNEIDGRKSTWVCQMGHIMGLFDEDWLGIPATGKLIFLPYVEFDRVVDGKIAETAFFCDIISVMKQAGLSPLPENTGAFIINPGPRTSDGLLYQDQDAKESKKTLDLINQMCSDLTRADMESSTEELRKTWHEDMLWFGPAGIGATYTINRYEKQHQGPFNEGLKDIVFNGHVARFAEGNYGGWFGWANLSMTTNGGFLGMPASNARTEMRVVDIYRREGDKLAENWIFIDLLHFLHKQGLDVLGRLNSINSNA